jgi:hypothetical protein
MQCPSQHARLRQERTCKIWPQAPLQTSALTTSTCYPHLWRHHPIHHPSRQVKPSIKGREEIHSTSSWDSPLLWSNRQRHHLGCTQLPHFSPSHAHQRHHATNMSPPQLCGNPSQCHPHLCQEQHDPWYSQQRIISQQAQSTQPLWRPFFPLRWYQQSPQQWYYFKYLPNHQICHVLCCQSQTWRVLHQRTQGSTVPNVPQRSGA